MKPKKTILRILPVSVPAMGLVSLVMVGLSAHAATRIKQDNTSDLNLAASWDVVPGAADIAQWNATVTGANSTVAGADLGWLGIKIVDPGGLVTLGGTHTLTLTSAGIDLSTATQDLTISSALTLKGKQSWKAVAGRTLDVTGTLNRAAATVDFTSFGGTLGTLVNTCGILGPWATTGSGTSINYATSTSGVISAFTTQIPGTAGTLDNVLSATDNYSFGASAVLTVPLTANTLRYTGGAASLTHGTNNMTMNGLMHAGTGLLTVGGAALPAAGAAPLTVGDSGVLNITSAISTATSFTSLPAPITTITASIVDGSAGSSRVVYSGALGDNLLLGLAAGASVQGPYNTFTGGLVIASGILRAGTRANGCLGGWLTAGTQAAPVNVTVNRKAILRLDRNAIRGFLTLNGGSVWTTNSFSDSWASISSQGSVTLAADSTFYTAATGKFTISVPVVGPGSLIKTGAGNAALVLTATNTYSGATTINGGIVQFSKPAALYNADETQWTAANITVKPVQSTYTTALPTPALRFNVGDVGFTSAQIKTLVANLTTSVNDNGLQAGATLALDPSTLGTTDATAPRYAVPIDAVIQDSAGTGGGQLHFKTFNYGTLELTGANTYTGKTSIDGFTATGNLSYATGTLKVSSLNSVATNGVLGTVHSASSSLGAPTTVADGTIDFGNSTGTNSATLIYSGEVNETTDRVLAFPGQAATHTIQQDGTAALKFTSAFAMGSNNVDKTLIIQGSNTGTGEIAGGIPNPGSTGITFITKSGTGTWILSGTNTYTGTTSINEGTLSVGYTNNLGNANPLSMNGGTLQVTGTAMTSFGTHVTTFGSGKTVSLDISNGSNIFTVGEALNQDNGGLIKSGAGKLVLTGANTYYGDTVVQAGTLAVNGSAIHDNGKLVISGGKVESTGTEVVNTLFFGTSQKAAGTWGATNSGANHIDDVHFTGTAGVVSVTTGPVGNAYELWTGDHGLLVPADAADADPDFDGLANALEFVLGGEPNPANPNYNSVDLLPKVSSVTGDMVFTFQRKDLSESASTLTFQWSTDLSFPELNEVPVGAVGSTTHDVGVAVDEDVPDADTDTIVITIPAAKAAGGKVFGRLRVTIP